MRCSWDGQYTEKPSRYTKIRFGWFCTCMEFIVYCNHAGCRCGIIENMPYDFLDYNLDINS